MLNILINKYIGYYRNIIIYVVNDDISKYVSLGFHVKSGINKMEQYKGLTIINSNNIL